MHFLRFFLKLKKKEPCLTTQLPQVTMKNFLFVQALFCLLCKCYVYNYYANLREPSPITTSMMMGSLPYFSLYFVLTVSTNGA